jgi:hypothetical protein
MQDQTMSGLFLDRFLLESKLGSGATGKVVLASDLNKDGRKVNIFGSFSRLCN